MAPVPLRWADENMIRLNPFSFDHPDIMAPVCLRWVAEEQPNPKWKIQLEHFQKTLAGANLDQSRLLTILMFDCRTTRTRYEWCLSVQPRRRRKVALLVLRLAHTTMLVLTGDFLQLSRTLGLSRILGLYHLKA